jgi:hypothetical protein
MPDTLIIETPSLRGPYATIIIMLIAMDILYIKSQEHNGDWLVPPGLVLSVMWLMVLWLVVVPLRIKTKFEIGPLTWKVHQCRKAAWGLWFAPHSSSGSVANLLGAKVRMLPFA